MHPIKLVAGVLTVGICMATEMLPPKPVSGFFLTRSQGPASTQAPVTLLS